MKKLIIALLIIIPVLTGLFFAYKAVKVPEENIVVDTKREYAEYINMIKGVDPDEDVSPIYDYTDVKIKGFPTSFSKSVKCEVTAPDLSAYWKENREALIKLDDEELHNTIVAALETMDRKTTEIRLEAEYENGYLLLESDCFEYYNAISGGLYTLLQDEYNAALDELLKEEQE